jgi:hypothetical protein
MPNLGTGSGRPGISQDLGDFSVAGVATRVTSGASPSDGDWPDAPPNGTIVFEDDGVMWVRLGGTWKSFLLESA